MCGLCGPCVWFLFTYFSKTIGLFYFTLLYVYNSSIMDRFETEGKIPYYHYNMYIVVFTGRVFDSSVQFPRTARKSGKMTITRLAVSNNNKASITTTTTTTTKKLFSITAGSRFPPPHYCYDPQQLLVICAGIKTDNSQLRRVSCRVVSSLTAL